MSNLYKFPLRVYLILGALVLIGILAGLDLPVSLFPNSSKPRVGIRVEYGGMTGDDFLKNYGSEFEGQLQSLSGNYFPLETLQASYNQSSVTYDLQFKWGVNQRDAYREVERMAQTYSMRLPQENRDSVQVWNWGDNSGFLAVSFYSETRSLDDLFKYLDPLLAPRLAAISDAQGAGLWNPTRKEVLIELNPEKMALYQILPRDLTSTIYNALSGNNAGQVTIGLGSSEVQVPRQVLGIDDFKKVVVEGSSGFPVHLGDIARVDLAIPSNDNKSFKTSGAPSLILFASPRPGGNLKKMSEDIMAVVRGLEPSLDKDIRYKVLVDPSEFIRSAVNNVVHEVVLAALLAVLVLFIFMGNIKNVVTAAIEIPMSIVLAFILMKLAHINLNLISLGGLALSAGMNVDASVVVMENIFQHFERAKGVLSPAARFKLIVQAVSEVKFPVIAATIASLVVFIPLALTSGLSNAILGDLALAVVFSHSFSAIVALVLVPTVRLQLMKSNVGSHEKPSPFEPILKKIESGYLWSLQRFLAAKKFQLMAYSVLIVSLVSLVAVVLPKLPREIVGMPDTDWIYLGVNSKGNTLTRQMENQAEEIESELLKKFGADVDYTFTQIQSANRAGIMARLKDKSKMLSVWKQIEATFANTPLLRFMAMPWNPSELPIPNPPQLRIEIRGGTVAQRAEATQELSDLIEGKQIFPRVWTEPSVERKEKIVMNVSAERWAMMGKGGARLQTSDIAELARVATVGKRIGYVSVDSQTLPVVVRFPEGRVARIEDLEALPVGVANRVLPVKALVQFGRIMDQPTNFRENGQELMFLMAKVNKGEESSSAQSVGKATLLVNDWKEKNLSSGGKFSGLSISFNDPEKDLTDALRELKNAVLLSVLLIFLTMVFQFGNVSSALLVLVAVPLGVIGVIGSLAIFKSTLSLNSVLGVILLNGIAVGNSIMLVDVMKRMIGLKMSPAEAARHAGKLRLRPILMTSMTTGLGMLPIALGLGEGGRILQPLGIAVIGGLFFSMLMTLYVVPGLQVSYMGWSLFNSKTASLDAEDFGESNQVTDAPTDSRPLEM